MRIIKGKDLKEAVSVIGDEDYVAIGLENDKIGRDDRKIVSIEKRDMGFDSDDRSYYVICGANFGECGAMKLLRNQ